VGKNRGGGAGLAGGERERNEKYNAYENTTRNRVSLGGNWHGLLFVHRSCPGIRREEADAFAGALKGFEFRQVTNQEGAIESSMSCPTR
jgi:hypothetical protein